MGEADEGEQESQDESSAEQGSDDGPDDSPPSHPCPEHPDTEVLGACSRCGTFYCGECLEEADRPPDSSRCPKCPLEVPEPRVLGGWLRLPAIQLVITPIQTAYRCVLDVNDILTTEFSELIPISIIELLYTTAFLGLTIVAGYHFFRKRKTAINLMLAFYLAAFTLPLLDLGVTYYVEHVLGFTQASGGGVLGGLIAPAIWIAYFTNSQRVRETFVVE